MPQMSTFAFFDGAGCFFEISNGDRHPKKFIRARSTYDWENQWLWLLKPFNYSDRCKNSMLISLYSGLWGIPSPKVMGCLPELRNRWNFLLIGIVEGVRIVEYPSHCHLDTSHKVRWLINWFVHFEQDYEFMLLSQSSCFKITLMFMGLDVTCSPFYNF